MEAMESVDLPYPRDTVKGILQADVNFVCRQVDTNRFRYWKIK